MIKHYSNNIQNEIQRELFRAKKSIQVAVAWFTNDLLFQPLLLKLSMGVSVDIILNRDKINTDNNPIFFDDFFRLGGKLYWNDTGTLMHEKFCVIDESVVITGSYNWTSKAEKNEESVIVFYDEADTVSFYHNQFSKLCKLYSIESADHAAIFNTGEGFEDAVEKVNIGSLAPKTTRRIVILDGRCGDNAFFSLFDDGELDISGSGSMYDYHDRVDSRSYRPWEEHLDSILYVNCSVKLGSNAFACCRNLVKFESSIEMENIPYCAFNGCWKLKTVLLKSSPTYIGHMAFKDCYQLDLRGSNLIVDAETIESWAFQHCNSIFAINARYITPGIPYTHPSFNESFDHYDYVNIPLSGDEEWVHAWKDHFYRECKADEEDSCDMCHVIYLGEGAFSGCENLRSACVPKSIEYMPGGVFDFCSSLKRLMYLSDLYSGSGLDFEECHNLRYIFKPRYNDSKIYDDVLDNFPLILHFPAQDPREDYLKDNAEYLNWKHSISVIELNDLPYFNNPQNRKGNLFTILVPCELEFPPYPYVFLVVSKENVNHQSYLLACKVNGNPKFINIKELFWTKHGTPIDKIREDFINYYSMRGFACAYEDLLAGGKFKIDRFETFEEEIRGTDRIVTRRVGIIEIA